MAVNATAGATRHDSQFGVSGETGAVQLGAAARQSLCSAFGVCNGVDGVLTRLMALLGLSDKPGAPAPEDCPELPFPVEYLPGASAVEARRSRLGGEVVPILMGEPKDLDLLSEIIESNDESLEQVLARAAAMDIEEWLSAREEEEFEDSSAMAGSWPTEESPPIELSIHLDVLSRKPKSTVILGLVPTRHAWQVPAYLRLGGWNDCPEAPIHVALHKRWHIRYGAEIACVTSDVVECSVGRPPTTREDALALAREQYLYCPDIVNQGVESIENLAALLMRSKSWYFWWD